MKKLRKLQKGKLACGLAVDGEGSWYGWGTYESYMGSVGSDGVWMTPEMFAGYYQFGQIKVQDPLCRA